MKCSLISLSFAGLFSAIDAGTFKLYSVDYGTATPIPNHGVVDLAELSLGSDPRVTVLYEPDDFNATQSVLFRIIQRTSTGMIRHLLSPTCAVDDPFFIPNGGAVGSPNPFSFPMGDPLKLSARPSWSASCIDFYTQENVHFRVINSYVGTSTVAATTVEGATSTAEGVSTPEGEAAPTTTTEAAATTTEAAATTNEH